jgi:hypothetical protein
MISLVNQDVDAHVEPRRDADPAYQQMSSGQITNVEALRSLQPEPNATLPGPKFTGTADARALEAYVERRRKLAAQIRLENPSRTEEEIEARLEQFGA